MSKHIVRSHLAANITQPISRQSLHTVRWNQTRSTRILAHYRPRSAIPRQRLESSLTLTTIAFGAVATVVAIAVFIPYTPFGTDVTQVQRKPSESSSSAIDRASADPAMPPQGWPGNLTAEQETKLKELWEILSKLTGVAPGKPSLDGRQSLDTATPAQEDGAADPGSAKKKKRFGFLRRGNAEESNGDNAMEGEDKYGQTKEFKQAIADQTPQQLRETIWSFTKGDDPDALLCRYLRARKWNVQNALVMMISTVHWRGQVVHLDDQLIRYGEMSFFEKSQSTDPAEKKLGEDFMAQIRMGKSYIHGTDNEGRPLCVVRVRLHHGGEQGEESLEKFTVFTIETARMMLSPEIDTATLIFDMTDFSMANMDYSPVKFMIKCFEANYPESLGAICVHKSPWLFHSIWTIIRGWLDPVVASKVHFTKDVKELSEFVPRSHIPTELGGDEEWKYEYVEPKVGENEKLDSKYDGERQRLETERWGLVEEYEKATQKWCQNESGPEIMQSRHEVATRLAQNYWKLDPYIRAKSLYDRTGVINEGGKINMYPKRLETKADDVD